ncbi:hypothetical protein LAZ67_7000328 [Cordylochernes scorpioides]|uniref:Reverse transcriptase zinc-binding domain-containing protein n=1 Tax=Cordylochernes scorpioides TaxID=51811 RepID=A0ABY6KRH0_9ARAC|nr:hypothetical protein LAZ67_7000328 [Cordylochernes scorpioides]
MKGNKAPIRSRITDVHLGSVLKLITANKISPEVGKMPSDPGNDPGLPEGPADPTCINCSEEPQTVDHLLFSYPAFLRHRIQTAILIGLTHLNPRSMASLPDSISAWINSTIKTGPE